MPLRHSTVFWLGFFPLVILLWAWADSMKMETHWAKTERGDGFAWAVLANSKLMWGTVTADPAKPHQAFPITRWWGASQRLEGRAWRHPGWRVRLFPALSDREAWRYDQGENYIHTRGALPLWCLLAGYLPLWLGLACWRARRKRI